MVQTAEIVHISAYVDAVNRYKVPKNQWRKWTREQRVMFNIMYSQMSRGQDYWLHPDAVKAKHQHWLTTCWNAAWSAAEAVLDLE